MNKPPLPATLARPFAHIPGVSYPAASASERVTEAIVAAVVFNPTPRKRSPLAGVTLRRSALGFRYAYHKKHA